jgi:hypothetical protein
MYQWKLDSVELDDEEATFVSRARTPIAAQELLKRSAVAPSVDE